MPKNKIQKKLKPGEERVLKYINQKGVEVLLPESIAGPLHYQMKKFLGDQVGDMRPPKNAVPRGTQVRDSSYSIGQNGPELTKEEFLKHVGKH